MRPRLLDNLFLPRVLAAVTFLLLVPEMQTVAAERSDPAELAFFEKKIRPVLVRHCYECHSSQAKKVRGKFFLDTRDGIRRGGESGPAVVPGDLDKSLLIQALRHEGFEMPPTGKLPDSVIADFEQWVRSGAHDSREGPSQPRTAEINLAEARKFWAFRPVQDHPVPVVSDDSWPRSDIDRFLLASMEANNFKPAGDAGRRTLLRRVYFDLIGLPPTPEEIDAFTADGSPDAFVNLVDRLLASPRFGERWGRHWLDVARFAESSGGGRTRIFDNAWRYRDYVIDSFNADKPFDRFITEQIAGDLLSHETSEQRAEQLTATAFLVLGPINYELQDKELLDMEVVDEQLDTLGRTFLGMTIGCARCHDHKFDPIPTADYYALAGIFLSTKTLIHKNVSDFVERELPTSPEHRRALDKHAERVKKVEQEIALAREHLKELTQRVNRHAVKSAENAPAAVDESGSRNRDRSGSVQQLSAAKTHVIKLEARLKQLEKSAPRPPPLTMGVEDNEEPGHCRICIRGDVHSQGPVVPRGFLSVATSGPTAGFPENESGRRQLAQWIASPQNPLTARVICNRIWHHLFGQGIVRTVDNFGHVGERPSHPELLDWLAVRFVNDGWSTKLMVRRIVLSRAYQLTSERDGGDTADPENRWLARMNRRRLEAETIRDAVLFVSGRLDLEGGGPTIRKGMKSEFDYRFKSQMRSVYVPVFRNALHDLFEVFDFPDPNLVIGRRNTSTLPTQALYLMNSPFVRTQSRFAARRLLRAAEVDHAGGIDAAYRQVLGRPPTDEEFRLAAAFLRDMTAADDGQQSERKSAQRRLQSWTALYQSLFSCIDFRYLH